MRVVHLISLLIILLISPHSIFSQDTLRSDTTSKKAKLIEDDAVVAMLDSLSTLKIFSDAASPHALKYPSWSNYTETEIPVFSDSVYAARIALMNENSPFEYIYNSDVKKFIDLYAVRKRKLTARILGLSEIYFPLFEEQLDRFDMPLELKYLAVIESALNPVANSKAGAKGLWQFMYGTGRVYGLKVSSYVDDRYDPFKATIAACEHLKDLYDIYGNWSLALAAYNSGAGNVNKAIRRSGGLKNFWAIHRFLPKETRAYVPAFIAASYVLAYANEHKIYPVDPGILYYEVDTVTVRHPLTFGQISEMLNIPWDEIDFLNPAYKQGVIPATPEMTYKLRLRKKNVGDFINNENALYAYKTKDALSDDASLAAIYASYHETQQYTVKKGETVAGIAKKFHMSIPEFKSLNNLSKNYVKPKQKVFVYTPGSAPKIPDSLLRKRETPPAAVASVQKPVASSVTTAKQPAPKPVAKTPVGNSKFIYYTILSGDNLWDLADHFNVTVAQIKKLNGINNASYLKPGQKIKIPK